MQTSNAENQEIENALISLKTDTPMKQKIELANTALPDYLKPNGLNPLGSLYRVLSEGIHGLSDQECLKKAEVAKDCIKFLISELTSRKKSRDEFTRSINQL